MSRIHHMQIDIAGCLRNHTDRQLGRMFHGEDGSTMTGPQVRDWLRLQLAHGKRLLPCADNCEGFDFQTGCPGHDVPEVVAENPLIK